MYACVLMELNVLLILSLPPPREEAMFS